MAQSSKSDDEFDFDTSNWDIVKEIDKFLEGYTSDRDEVPEENNHEDIELDIHNITDNQIIKTPEPNTSNLELNNNSSIIKENEVEYIGKNSAVFQLLEDNEKLVEYEHVPNECNWNVFYQTLPTEEVKYNNIKIEPGTETFNDYPIQNGVFYDQTSNIYFSVENPQNQNNCQSTKIKLEPLTEETNEQYEGDIDSNEITGENVSSDFFINDGTSTNNELVNFSFVLDCNLNQESSHVQNPSNIESIQTEVERPHRMINKVSNNKLDPIQPIWNSSSGSEKFSFSFKNIFQGSMEKTKNVSLPDTLEVNNHSFLEKRKDDEHEDGELIDSVIYDEFTQWRDPYNKYSNDESGQSSYRSYEDIYEHSDQLHHKTSNLQRNHTFKNDFRTRFPHKKLPEPHNFKFSSINRSKSLQSKRGAYYKFIQKNQNKKRNNYLYSKFKPMSLQKTHFKGFRNPSKLTTEKLDSQVEAFNRPQYLFNPRDYKRNPQKDYYKNIDNSTWHQHNYNLDCEHTDTTSVFSTQPDSNKSEIEKLDVNITPQNNMVYKFKKSDYSYKSPNLHNIQVIPQENNNNTIKDPVLNSKNNSTMDIHDLPHATKSLLYHQEHYIIKDYLSPESLVGSTIKFSSRKLANTSVREKIITSLSTHGPIDNSWWTPDDLFFVTYTSRDNAQYVYRKYPKNKTSSY